MIRNPSGNQRSVVSRQSETVSIRSAGGRYPSINLSDGHELLTSYVGPDDIRIALEQNQAEPLSLASADFDEDGVPDLVIGYSCNAGGIVTLLRGNVDSIYPNAPEAQQHKANGTFTDAPFLSPASVFSSPAAGDFIGAGDFDADGHWDVAVASRLHNTIYLLSGDGRGTLSLTKQIPLPGVVTAMATGEMNRADGLTDIVVAVQGGAADVLVFEGPEGALRACPEVFEMPAAVTSLQLAQLSGEYTRDLAVAAGDALVIVQGRDRQLSLDEAARAKVSPAVRRQAKFDSPIAAMAAGNFAGNTATDLAVETASGLLQVIDFNSSAHESAGGWSTQTIRHDAPNGGSGLVGADVSTSAYSDLIIADEVNRQLQLLHSTNDSSAVPLSAVPLALEADNAPVAVLPLRLSSSAMDSLVVLRKDHVAPAITGISPAATFTVVNTNASGPGSLQFAILDANETPGADLINFNIPGTGPFTINQTIPLPTITDPVTIDGTTQPGFAGAPVIMLTGNGLLLSAGTSTIRSLNINTSNYSIEIQGSGSCLIEGNTCTSLGIYSPNNTVGGTTAASRNQLGLTQCFDNPGGNNIRGNVIAGVLQIRRSITNIVGGTVAGARNIINGSNSGVTIEASLGPTTGNLVQGNFIGTDVAGTASSNNASQGVSISNNASSNTIGGTTVAARNIISGNQNGLLVTGGGSGNFAQGNYFGTDVNGTADLGNTQNGVRIDGANGNTVGGTAAGAGNVLSGNGLSGVLIENSTANVVQGNFIGTNAGGNAALGNDLNGVTTSQAPNNTIGGPTVDARNIISANGRHGVSIGIDTQSGSTGVTVQNNYIGTDVSGNNCLGNLRDGVFVNRGSVNHTILDNLITCNGRNGVNIPNFASNDPGIQIQVVQNMIYGNGALGIDLGDAGITSNDLLDTDGGANLQQNFPVLTSISSAAGSGKPGDMTDALTVNGTLNSAANQTFTVHWYFSGTGQCTNNQANGRPVLSGKVPGVNTNANGDAQFSFPFDFPIGMNSGIINCTATDAQGNTSEFSACFSVSSTAPTPTPTPTATPTPTPSLAVTLDASAYNAGEGIGTQTVTVMLTNSAAGPVTVNYTTSDAAGANKCDVKNGVASSRCDYETTVGTLSFAAGETSKTIRIPIMDDSYAEGNETFTFSLSSPVGANLGTPSSATITINDNDAINGTNPISDARYFVRVHYTDFLNREPDQGGWDFWTSQITSCGSNVGCTEVARVNVSASFFLSIEFQQTGYLVERVYKVAYDDVDGTSTFPNVHTLRVPVVRFNEFLADTQQITRGVVVLQPGWEQLLESNKVAFFNDFVQRSRFTTALPTSMTPAQFVDRLNKNGGSPLSPAEVTNLAASGKSRAEMLRAVAEHPNLVNAEFNRAFVLMQYFGYLRRNPDDPQDSDYTGYDFWLVKLNQFGGNYERAEMVKAFITSLEYGNRFGP